LVPRWANIGKKFRNPKANSPNEWGKLGYNGAFLGSLGYFEKGLTPKPDLRNSGPWEPNFWGLTPVRLRDSFGTKSAYEGGQGAANWGPGIRPLGETPFYRVCHNPGQAAFFTPRRRPIHERFLPRRDLLRSRV